MTIITLTLQEAASVILSTQITDIKVSSIVKNVLGSAFDPDQLDRRATVRRNERREVVGYDVVYIPEYTREKMTLVALLEQEKPGIVEAVINAAQEAGIEGSVDSRDVILANSPQRKVLLEKFTALANKFGGQISVDTGHINAVQASLPPISPVFEPIVAESLIEAASGTIQGSVGEPEQQVRE